MHTGSPLAPRRILHAGILLALLGSAVACGGGGGDDALPGVLEAELGDPAFASAVALLTNGSEDAGRLRIQLGGGSSSRGFLDTNPAHFAESGLPGPDLAGATITRIAFLVRSVEMTVGSTTRLVMDAELQIHGFAP